MEHTESSGGVVALILRLLPVWQSFARVNYQECQNSLQLQDFDCAHSGIFRLHRFLPVDLLPASFGQIQRIWFCHFCFRLSMGLRVKRAATG